MTFWTATLVLTYTDTHAHLTDPALVSQIDLVLQRAAHSGVSKILCVGTTAATSREAVELASKHSQVYASVGIHPNYAHEAAAEDWKSIRSLVDRYRVVALGETGLDRYWDDCPWETQLANFHRHWELSRQTGLPVIIHSRDCDDEMVEQLRIASTAGPLRGVMHAFSGSLAMAEACLELGLYFSFAGMVTYKKSEALRTVASRLPLDRLLVETDAPYLSPEPKRSTRPNEPALVVHTAACLAKCKGIKPSELANITTTNAESLFRFEGGRA